MHLLLALAFGLIGGLISGPGGFVFGALLGLGAGYIRALQQDVKKLQARLDGVDRPSADQLAPAATQVVPPVPATVPPTETRSDDPTPATSTTTDSVATGAQAARPQPARPRPPSQFEDSIRKLVSALVGFFTTGNLVVRVGVGVLFIGVVFLLVYAYEQSLLGVELRLTGSAIGGIALVITGWRLRLRADTYGVVLQGAGVGILYLTIFAAASMYDLLDMSAAFSMLVVLVVASSLLAVLQNAQSLAIFSMVGGFLAPVLVSTDMGNHVALFSFYALLNAGILAMAWFRFWRWLNWVGFLFTFAIGATWGYQFYKPEFFNTTEPFLVLFFAYYLGVSLLFARRKEVDLKGIVDGTLVFGTPVIAFALQAGLVSDMEFGLAYSALGAAATYVLLALILQRQDAFSSLLGQSFLALGMVFATLAIPFAFDNQRWTGAAWALEGAGLLWVGLRQSQALPRIFGMLLQLAAAAVFLSHGSADADATVLANSTFFGAVMLSLAGGYTAYQLAARRDILHKFERPAHWVFLAWATLWWFGGFIHELGRYQPSGYGAFDANNVNEHLFVLLAALTTAGLILLARTLRWRDALIPGFLLLPMMAIVLLGLDSQWAQKTPFADLGWIAWPAAFASLAWHLNEARDLPRPLPLWHAATWWFVALFITWTAVALTHQALPETTWVAILWGAVPTLLVVGLLNVKSRARWPLSDHLESYLGWGMAVMIAALGTWLCFTGIQAADPAPLPYIVIMNPMELTHLAILFVAFIWSGRLNETLLSSEKKILRIVIAGVGFIWLNLTAARAVHYYGGVAYPIEQLMESDAFQTTVTILWTVTALVLMGIGSRRRLRASWVVGASLLGLVVLKLFALDWFNLDVVARIISFISVGVLMLLIGYLAPLPPARKEAQAS